MLSEVLTFVTRFAADETVLEGLPSSFVVVDGADLAAAVNRALVATRCIAVVNGAHLPDGWAQRCAQRLGKPFPLVDVVSPYVDLGNGPEEWWEPISPHAWVATSDAILMTGGLDERLTFGHDRVLAHRCTQLGLTIAHDPDVVARVVADHARDTALGTLYYKQIADDNAVNEQIGAR